MIRAVVIHEIHAMPAEPLLFHPVRLAFIILLGIIHGCGYFQLGIFVHIIMPLCGIEFSMDRFMRQIYKKWFFLIPVFDEVDGVIG